MLHGARSDLMRGTISGHRERQSDAIRRNHDSSGVLNGTMSAVVSAIMAHQVYSAGPWADQSSCLSAVVNCLLRSFLAREMEVIFSYLWGDGGRLKEIEGYGGIWRETEGDGGRWREIFSHP